MIWDFWEEKQAQIKFTKHTDNFIWCGPTGSNKPVLIYVLETSSSHLNKTSMTKCSNAE